MNKRYEVIWSDIADEDLSRIIDYILISGWQESNGLFLY